MKRFGTLFLSLLLAAALLAGCGVATTPAPTEAPPAVTEQPPAEAPAAPVETSAPTEAPAAREALNVMAFKGPTGMGMAPLMARMGAGETVVDYTFSLAGAPDEVAGKIVTGEVDIAAAPINLASTLYNRTEGGVVMLAVNTLGVLYILEDGEEIQGIADLAGKTLYATGQGATPEFILNYLLEKNGVKDAVTVEYKAEHAELATLLVAGEVKNAMLPEPNVTSAMMNNDSLRIALDLTEEWNKVSEGTQLVQGCIIARREVVEQKPTAVAQFLKEYAASTELALGDVEQTSAWIEQYGILPKAAVAKAALPKANIVCLTGGEMQKSAAAMLEILFAADPKSVGGALPGEDLYYMP